MLRSQPRTRSWFGLAFLGFCILVVVAAIVGPGFRCIARGTVVETPGGPRPVESLDVGDLVVSRSDRGETAVSEITSIERHVALRYRTITWHGGGSLSVTAHHPIATEDSWQQAGVLTRGRRVQGRDRLLTVESIAARYGPRFVYDVTVDPHPNFYADGVLVHNKSPARPMFTALGNFHNLLEAQRTYALVNAGLYGEIPCLITPTDCLRYYPLDLPYLLDDSLAALPDGMRRTFYDYSFHPGPRPYPRPDRAPASLRSFAVVAIPSDSRWFHHPPALCTDASRVIYRSPSSAPLAVVDGWCVVGAREDVYVDGAYELVDSEKLQSLQDADSGTRELIALGIRDGSSSPLVPALIETLREDPAPRTRRAAARALGLIGPASVEAVPSLVEALRDRDFEMRHTAAEALAGIGTPSREFLLQSLGIEDAGPWAALALAHIDPTLSDNIRPVLHRAMRHRNPEVRLAAARGLDEMGPEGQAFELLLDAFAQDSRRDVRIVAARSLGWYGERAAPAVPGLIQALDDNDEELMSIAATSLGYIGPTARAATSALARIAEGDHKRKVRHLAITSLQQFGPDAKASVPTLLRVLDDPDVASYAARALGSVAVDANQVVPSLIECVQSSRPCKVSAIRALGELGPDAAAAVPALSEVLVDSNPNHRLAATYAIDAIGANGPASESSPKPQHQEP